MIDVEKLVKEIDLSLLPYEDRIELFNKFQISVSAKALSPLVYISSILESTNSGYMRSGYSHSGAILSNINNVFDKEDVLKETYGIEIKTNTVIYYKKSLPKMKIIIRLEDGNINVRKDSNGGYGDITSYSRNAIKADYERKLNTLDRIEYFMSYFKIKK